ncbi:MAG: branched-chain amino acid ABC transporter permease [Proteobacteria bacterium]|nr:branched-chain amino acid ABC transporter permease [Pseudomonadota bacterium]
MLLNAIVTGIIMGGILTLPVLGVAMVYGITGVPNFAIGLIGVIGGYTTWYFASGLGLPLAIALGILVCFPIGFLLQSILLTPLSRKGADSTLFFIITVALGFVFQGLIRVIFPKASISIPLPRIGTVGIGDVSSDGIKFVALFVAVALLITIRILEKHTRIGKQLQATSQNLKLADLAGINTGLVFSVAHGTGCSLAAIGAIFWGSLYNLDLSTGWYLGFIGFIIAVIGGIGNIWGGLISALIMGIIMSFAGFYLGGVWQSVILYFAVMLVLIICPKGILGNERAI